MFCKYCGKEVEETAKFCPYCGGMLSSKGNYAEKEMPNTKDTTSVFSDHATETIACPYCGSYSCQITTKSTTQATGGGYNCLGGACGGILLGPVGLLMGLCGRKATATTTSKNVWLCHSCGKEFSALDEVQKQTKQQLMLLFIIAGVCSFLAGRAFASILSFFFYALPLSLFFVQRLKQICILIISSLVYLIVVCVFRNLQKNGNGGYAFDTLFSDGKQLWPRAIFTWISIIPFGAFVAIEVLSVYL